MKLPSIIKIPSYQRFNYEPRYYDPIKEDIEERTKRIKRRLAAEKIEDSSRARLEGVFVRRVEHQDHSSFLRLFVGVILFSGVVGFLYFGNIAIYLAALVVLGYLVFRKFVSK